MLSYRISVSSIRSRSVQFEGVMLLLPLLATLFLRVSLAHNVDAQDGLTLELASVVFRHGDRSPTGTFPKDNYTESDWPQGYGQLSLTGMAQQHQLGQILRHRYVTTTFPGFLNENYTRVQVYVRSTDVDRTLMSAEAQLSGLFPPNFDQQFVSNISWQPIPVHTVAKDQDLLLLAHHTDCPAYKRLLEADKTTEEYQKIETEHQEFFKYLADESGYDVVNLTNVGHLQSVLYIENITDGKEAPSWLTPQNLTELNKLADIVMWLKFNSLAKLRIAAEKLKIWEEPGDEATKGGLQRTVLIIGHWLQKVLWDMKGKANGTLNDAKLFLYSAHDTTVAPMMNALGVWNKKKPPYATAFFVELYSDKNSNYHVKLFWREGPYSEVVEQLNKTTKLTLEDFESYVTPLIPSDWNQECDIPSKQSSQESTVPVSVVVALGVLSFFSTVALIVVSVTLGLVCRHTKLKAGLHYQPVNSEVVT